jgi:uncharacterized protein GlcG (DUF336 family)
MTIELKRRILLITLSLAQTIITKTLDHAKQANFKALGVVVLDTRGTVIAAAIQDGSSLVRFDVAKGKANGAISFNMGSRGLEKLAKDRPHFMAGALGVVDGIIPVPGGVLIKSVEGQILGAVGVSGDTSDNDELAAIAGIQAAGLVADGG